MHRADAELLRHAHASGRVVLTHAGDFGALAVVAATPFVGIVRLRPGHIVPAFTLETIVAIESAALDVVPPFILVAERRRDAVRLRLRSPVSF